MGQDLMQRRKVSASLQLMQDLLTCPAGEEWILLKRHEDVVDAEFVQLMEQVAAQLQQEGDRHAATFLRNWAAQLHHVLLKEVMPHRSGFEPSPAHLELIQKLVRQPEKVDEILAQSGELIRPELVQVMYEMAQQLWAQSDRKTAQLLEQIAVRANQAWIQSHMASSQPSESTVAMPIDGPAETYLPETGLAETGKMSAKTAMKGNAAPARPLPAENQQTDAAKPVAQTQPIAQTQPRFQSASEAEQQPGAKRQFAAKAAATTQATSPQPQLIPDPWQSDKPMSSALQLKVPQQIANGLHEVTMLLHELNKTLVAQTAAIQMLTKIGAQVGSANPTPENPLWYLEALERAHELDWILSTDELFQLMGVKPQCHGDETIWVRGCWQFEKVGKLGTQTGWLVHKH